MSGAGAGKTELVDDLYRIVREAVENRRPMAAVYRNRRRLLCPHRLGRNKEGCLRVLCYRRLELMDSAWRTAPNHSRPASCIVTTDVDADDYPEREPQKGQ